MNRAAVAERRRSRPWVWSLALALLPTWAAAGTVGRTQPGTDAYPLLSTGALTLDEAERLPIGLVWGGTAVFASGEESGRVVKIDLGSLTSLGRLPLDEGEGQLSCALVSGRYGYYAGSGGKLVKLCLRDFYRYGALTLEPEETGLNGAVVYAGFAYFGTETGRIVKVDPGSMTRQGALRLKAGEERVVSGIALGKFAYFGIDRNPPRIVKVDLSTFQRVGHLDLPGASTPHAAFSQGRYGYFAGDSGLVKINLDSFRKVGALAFRPQDGKISCGVLEGGQLYLGTEARQGRILRVDPQRMALTGTLIGPSRAGRFQGVVVDAGVAYFSGQQSGGEGLAKIVEVPLHQQNGWIKASVVNVTRSLRPRSMRFFAHKASGQVRLALYDAQKQLLWQSQPVAIARANSFVDVPIATNLQLRPGIYSLAWQVSSTAPVPSYTRGTAGSGWQVPQAFGPFPSQIAGEVATNAIWTQFLRD